MGRGERSDLLGGAHDSLRPVLVTCAPRVACGLGNRCTRNVSREYVFVFQFVFLSGRPRNGKLRLLQMTTRLWVGIQLF